MLNLRATSHLTEDNASVHPVHSKNIMSRKTLEARKLESYELELLTGFNIFNLSSAQPVFIGLSMITGSWVSLTQF